jgi:Zn-finger nucleic acid-binding protein
MDAQDLRTLPENASENMISSVSKTLVSDPTVLCCPVCIDGHELRLIDAHLLHVALRRCDTCLGLLANEKSVTAAADHYHEKHYVMAVGHGRHGCRACGQLFDAARGVCPRCGEGQTIRCAQCAKSMSFVHIAGVTLDVCWECHMVWFDRGELGLLTRRHGTELKQRLSAPPTASAPQSLGVSALGDVGALALDPIVALEATEFAVRGVGAAAQAAPELALAAGEAAVGAGEVAIEASSTAVEVLLDVVGDIFS